MFGIKLVCASDVWLAEVSGDDQFPNRESADKSILASSLSSTGWHLNRSFEILFLLFFTGMRGHQLAMWFVLVWNLTKVTGVPMDFAGSAGLPSGWPHDTYRKRFAESMLTIQQLRTFTGVRESSVCRELKSGKD